MQYLKADTETKVVIGPVVAVGDGFTPVTTLSLSTADEAEMLKHDASAVTDISGNTFAAITGADGYYNLTLTAAQLDTEGRLTVLINDDSLCLPVRHDFIVQNANVFDSLHAAAATDYLQTDVTQVSAAALTSITNDILDEALSGHNVAGSVGKAIRQVKEATITAESSVNDLSATTTSFVTDLTEATDDFYNDKVLVFNSGTLSGQARVINDYNGTTKAVTLDEALTSAPSDGDSFIIIATHEHSIAQIQSGLATAAALATVDSNVDAILVDTGTTLPATLTSIEGKVDTVDAVVDAVLVDTGTTLPASIATIDTNVDAILVDTGTTLPATLSTLEGKVDTVDTVVDAVKLKTDLIPASFNTEWANVYDVQITGITTTVETAAGKHSVAGTVMMSTNAELADGVLTAKKPSDDTTFQTYTVTTSASANNITGVS